MLGFLILVGDIISRTKNYADKTSYTVHSLDNSEKNKTRFFSDGRGHEYDRITGHQVLFGGYKDGCTGILDLNTGEFIVNWTKNKQDREIEDYINVNISKIKNMLLERKKHIDCGDEIYDIGNYIIENKFNPNYRNKFEIIYKKHENMKAKRECVFNFCINPLDGKRYRRADISDEEYEFQTNNRLLYEDFYNLSNNSNIKLFPRQYCNMTFYTMEELYEYADWIGAKFNRLNKKEIYEYRYGGKK